MLNATKLRVSLAVITLAGAFHLNSAQAAETASADDCDSYANGYAVGYCAAGGGRPASITYTCRSDGTAAIEAIKCIYPT